MIPTQIIEEELIKHLLEGHRVPEARLLLLKETVTSSEWAGFLVRSHYILHTIARDGEYHDEQFHFKGIDSDEPGLDPAD